MTLHNEPLLTAQLPFTPIAVYHPSQVGPIASKLEGMLGLHSFRGFVTPEWLCGVGWQLTV